MPIIVDCPCGKKLKVRDELVGKKIKCPGCGAIQEVRQEAVAIEPPAVEVMEPKTVTTPSQTPAATGPITAAAKMNPKIIAIAAAGVVVLLLVLVGLLSGKSSGETQGKQSEKTPTSSDTDAKSKTKSTSGAVAIKPSEDEIKEVVQRYIDACIGSNDSEIAKISLNKKYLYIDEGKILSINNINVSTSSYDEINDTVNLVKNESIELTYPDFDESSGKFKKDYEKCYMLKRDYKEEEYKEAMRILEEAQTKLCNTMIEEYNKNKGRPTYTDYNLQEQMDAIALAEYRSAQRQLSEIKSNIRSGVYKEISKMFFDKNNYVGYLPKLMNVSGHPFLEWYLKERDEPARKSMTGVSNLMSFRATGKYSFTTAEAVCRLEVIQSNKQKGVGRYRINVYRLKTADYDSGWKVEVPKEIK